MTDQQLIEEARYYIANRYDTDYKVLIRCFEAVVDRFSALQTENAELQIRHRTEHCEAAGYDCAELAGLKAALSHVEAERDAAKKEIERLKDIMRENGIMVIPSKYPGGRSEWNIRRGAQGEG